MLFRIIALSTLPVSLPAKWLDIQHIREKEQEGGQREQKNYSTASGQDTELESYEVDSCPKYHVILLHRSATVQTGERKAAPKLT